MIRNDKRVNVKIKFLHPDAEFPSKAHMDDFCYDCVAVSEEEIAPNVWKYGLGFALQLAEFREEGINYGFTIRPRSSVWKTGMVLSNSVGTIDDGYTGELSAVFYHVMPDMPRYKVGNRICQLHFDGCCGISFRQCDTLTETKRGVTGYGSTGK